MTQIDAHALAITHLRQLLADAQRLADRLERAQQEAQAEIQRLRGTSARPDDPPAWLGGPKD